MCSNLTTFFASNVDAPLLLPHLAVKRRKIRRKWMRLNLDKHDMRGSYSAKLLKLYEKLKPVMWTLVKVFVIIFTSLFNWEIPFSAICRFKLFYASPLGVFYNGKFRVIDLECKYERYFYILHFLLVLASAIVAVMKCPKKTKKGWYLVFNYCNEFLKIIVISCAKLVGKVI